jgi:hypothetical protein
MRRIFFLIFILLVSCAAPDLEATPISTATAASIRNTPEPGATPDPTQTPEPTTAPPRLVPDFAHIVVVVFENREFGSVIGNPQMPNYNRWAQENTLLTRHYAVTHPSLPNYLALIGGGTFGITSNCTDCFVDAISLPDLIEASGRTWKTYQEDLPSLCYVGDTLYYAQKHNPFIYFTPIREDKERCERSVVPLSRLDEDVPHLPDFVFITPNLCNSGHDCPLDQVDRWAGALMSRLLLGLEASPEPYLIILTWDEGQGDHSCCGLPVQAGGRVATILISPQAKSGFQDNTPYTHYSLLKTIAEAWGLPYLGEAQNADNVLIIAPWNP